MLGFIFRPLVNAGVVYETPPSLRKCIRLTNLAALIISLSMLPFWALYWVNQLLPVTFTVVLVSCFSLVVLLLNHYRYYLASRLSLLLVCNGVGFANSVMLGQESLIFLYMIAGLPSTVALFRARESTYVSLALLYAITLLVLDLVFCVKPLPQLMINDSLLLQIRVMVVPGSLLCMLLFVLFFLNENKRAQKRAEQVAIGSEILKNDLDGVFLTTQTGEILYSNPAASGMYGYESTGMLHRNFDVLGTDKQRMSLIHHSLTMHGAWSGEVRQRRKSGESLTVWLTAFEVKNADGDDLGIAYSCKDITRYKQTEQALIEAKDKAEEAAVAKANFLATMSHEIRTPLNGVIGITHLLLEDNPKPEHVESLRVLRFAAENLLTLVNDVLDFSKIEAGRVKLETLPLKLTDLLDSIRRSAEYTATEKGIHFSSCVDKALDCYVVGDGAKLTQILFNLISNAIKFTTEGEVTLNANVIDRSESDAGQPWLKVCFSVSDTGIGIAEAQLDHIFDQFSQADASITRQFGGSGLGLSITKGLLAQWGSTVSVQSKEGEGSTFSFTLQFPLADNMDNLYDSSTAGLNREDCDVSGLHILVAEDNPVNVMVIRKLLLKWGVSVDVAVNGREALECLSAKQYDVVLMDIQMPEMDGLEATRQIRALNNPRIRSIPVIALTATITDDIKQKMQNVGMDGYLGKPFDPYILKKQIRSLSSRQLEGL